MIEKAFGQRHRDRGFSGQARGDVQGGGKHIGGGNRFVRETHLRCLGAGEELAQQGERLRLGQADAPRQCGNSAPVDECAKGDLGKTQLRLAGDDHEIGRESQLQSRANGMPVDGGQYRLVAVLNGAKGLLTRAHISASLGIGQLTMAMRLEISAHAECPPCAREHNRAHRSLLGEHVEGLRDR